MKMSGQNSRPRRFRFSVSIATFLVLALIAGGVAAEASGLATTAVDPA